MTRRLATHTTDRSSSLYSSLYREYLVHKADLALLRLELAHARYERLLRKYDPNQPRVPAGNSDGGQWTSYGGSGSSTVRSSTRQQSLDNDANPWTDVSDRRPVSLTLRDRSEVPTAPPNVDLEANIREAQLNRRNYGWFYGRVRPGGPWDYKRRSRDYENFGNFHYGVTGAAAGFSEETLLRMAGRAQGSREPQWGKPVPLFDALDGVGGTPPFGDDPKDQYWISKGIEYYRRHYERRA